MNDEDLKLLMDVFSDEEREVILAEAGEDRKMLESLVLVKAMEYGLENETEEELELYKHTLVLNQFESESHERAIARHALMPELGASYTMLNTLKGKIHGEHLNINELANELRSQIAKVKSGNLGRAEDMLVAQAHILDRLFNSLVVRASANMSEYANAADTFMKMALKSQAQCRATWEAISSIKNPSTVKANQVNVAHNQQVNNHPENEKAPNQLRDKDELSEDRCTPGIEQKDSPSLQTLGEINRAKVG